MDPVTTTPSNNTFTGRSSRLRGRLIILFAVVVFAFSLRTAVTSLTPLLERISGELEFGATVGGVLGMLPTLMFGVAGLVSPALGRRYGLETVTLAAVVITAVGIAARSFSQDVWTLLALSCVALFGMGVGNILIPPLVKKHFTDRIASISTLYIVFVQLGTMIPAALAVPVADRFDWRISLGLWALVPLIALPAWIQVVRMQRAARRSDAAVVDEGPKLAVWRSPMTWGLTVMFGMTSAMTYSIFTWLPKVLTDAGASESLGGTAVAGFSAVGFAATFVAPWLCTRFENPFGFVLLFAACWLGGFAGLLWAPLSATWLWVILAGLGPTTFPMALTLINVRSRTSAGSSALSGFGQGVGYLLACAGPMLFGVLHDSTDGWTVPFAFLAVLVVLMLAGAQAICRPRYLEDTLA